MRIKNKAIFYFYLAVVLLATKGMAFIGSQENNQSKIDINSFLAGVAVQITKEIPLEDQPAFQGWRFDKNFSTGFESEIFIRPAIHCKNENSKLLPTHSGQEFKIYYEAHVGAYNAYKLPAASEACKIPSKSKNANGESHFINRKKTS